MLSFQNIQNKNLINLRMLLIAAVASVLAVALAVGINVGKANAATANNIYVCPDEATPCTGADPTIQTSDFDTIQEALNDAATKSGSTTVWVQKGQTFTENIVFKSDNVKLRGAEPAGGAERPVVVTDGSSSYGIDINGRKHIDIRYMDFQVGVGDATLNYHLKIYNVFDFYMRHADFYGPGKDDSNGVTGMDFNSTRAVQIVQSGARDYSNNGIAVTARFDADDYISRNYKFLGVVSENNGWNGLAFYNFSTTGVNADINNVTFATFRDRTINEFRNNNWSGIAVHGAMDADMFVLADPSRHVSSSTGSATLDVSDVHFSGNVGFDIFNYQTNDVSAGDAYFRPLSLPSDVKGSVISSVPAAKAAQNNKFFDKLDSSNIGLVDY